MSETPADASRIIVLQAIKRLTDEHGSATYQQIIDAAGISPHIVKERCDQLVNVTHEVERISRGVYRAIKAFARPRPISKTVLSDGEVVLEIGDDVIHLTPQEDKMLRGLFGSAPVEIHQPQPPMQASTVRSGRFNDHAACAVRVDTIDKADREQVFQFLWQQASHIRLLQQRENHANV